MFVPTNLLSHTSKFEILRTPMHHNILLIILALQHIEGQSLPIDSWRHFNLFTNRDERTSSQYRGNVWSARRVPSSFCFGFLDQGSTTDDQVEITSFSTERNTLECSITRRSMALNTREDLSLMIMIVNFNPT